MRYRKVRRNSYKWLYWLYAVWMLLFLSSIVAYIFCDNKIALVYMCVEVIMGILYLIKIRPHITMARGFSRLIYQHIEENALYQLKSKIIKKQKMIYELYPDVYFKVDKTNNTLCIRFRLTGNTVNLRGLEQGLADRLQRICLNVLEERGYIEYLFELEMERQMEINCIDDIHDNCDNTKIRLSESLVWDYRKTPHFMIVGTTGSGKTTFTRFLISCLLNKGVRVVYVDIKRDTEMESFCHGNTLIKYAYEEEKIAKVIGEIAEEIQLRTKDIEDIGGKEDYDYGFNPVYLICDEIILMKLLFSKKLYDETIKNVNAIIAGGRSKGIFCGLISQSALAEYFGNSGVRSNVGMKVALGQLTSTEYSMIFGEQYASVKNLRHNTVGSGLIMRHSIDSRPREYVAPYIKAGALET